MTIKQEIIDHVSSVMGEFEYTGTGQDNINVLLVLVNLMSEAGSDRFDGAVFKREFNIGRRRTTIYWDKNQLIIKGTNA